MKQKTKLRETVGTTLAQSSPFVAIVGSPSSFSPLASSLISQRYIRILLCLGPRLLDPLMRLDEGTTDTHTHTHTHRDTETQTQTARRTWVTVREGTQLALNRNNVPQGSRAVARGADICGLSCTAVPKSQSLITLPRPQLQNRREIPPDGPGSRYVIIQESGPKIHSKHFL